MIFRKPQKKVEIPVLHIGGENIDCVNNFNFLGILLNQHLRLDTPGRYSYFFICVNCLFLDAHCDE